MFISLLSVQFVFEFETFQTQEWLKHKFLVNISLLNMSVNFYESQICVVNCYRIGSFKMVQKYSCLNVITWKVLLYFDVDLYLFI